MGPECGDAAHQVSTESAYRRPIRGADLPVPSYSVHEGLEHPPGPQCVAQPLRPHETEDTIHLSLDSLHGSCDVLDGGPESE